MFNPFLLSGATYFPGGRSFGDIGIIDFDADRDEAGLFDAPNFDLNTQLITPTIASIDTVAALGDPQLLNNSAGLMAQALFNLMVDNGHVFDAESSGCACCGHDHGMNAKQEIAALTDQITALLDGGLESIGGGNVLAAIADLGGVDAQIFSNAFQDMAVVAAQSGTGPAANEPNGGDLPADTSTTGTIAVGGSATGTRSSGADEDWFAVDLDQGTTYTFIMLRSGDNPHEDPFLYLYNSSGTLITSNDDIEIDGDTSVGENRNSFITFTATETGTVYLGAGGYESPSGDFISTGDYTLYVEVGADRPDFTLQESAFFLTSQFDNKSTWNKTALTYDISALSAGAQTLALAAMAEWASVSGLTFTQATGAADITYNENQAADGGAQAFASSTESNGTITSVTVTVSDNWSGDYTFNSYRYQTYLHEVGYALGLGRHICRERRG
jgi:hypothetical protein